MKVRSESEVAQSCPTLPDSMDCSLSGSSAPGIFQARVLEWGAMALGNYGPTNCMVQPKNKQEVKLEDMSLLTLSFFIKIVLEPLQLHLDF